MSYKEYERMMVIENVWVPVVKAALFIGGANCVYCNFCLVKANNSATIYLLSFPIC